MRLLLDTHVWIWSQEAPDRIGPRAQAAILAPEAWIGVSTVSSLEIARLVHVGLLKLAHPLERWITRSLRLLEADTIELSHAIAVGAYALPEPFAKDPADRLLVATARLRHLTLLTADERLLEYPHVASMDARK